MDCLFCNIAKGNIPVKLLYEDELDVAFDDINPQAPVHFLVIPKKHIAKALDLGTEDNALVGHLYQVANKIARDKGIAVRGHRLVMNCNAEAGQTVWHVHLHVMGGRLMNWPPG